MGRGGNEDGNGASPAPRRGKLKPVPEMPDAVRGGSVFRAREDGRELEVLGVTEGWGHRGVIVRDRLSTSLIEPAVLFREYEQATEGAGESFSIVAPEPLKITETPIMFGGRPPEADKEPMSERQANYLRHLCEETGTEFNESWNYGEAGKMIGKLKKQTQGKGGGRAKPRAKAEPRQEKLTPA
jgi:hypothetical protein